MPGQDEAGLEIFVAPGRLKNDWGSYKDNYSEGLYHGALLFSQNGNTITREQTDKGG